MIHSLTGWRYVFAVVIFLHHYLIDGKSALQAGGTIGVAFFFILSGFLLAYGYKERLLAREISFASFWKSRAIKLYPLHILCFAAIFLFSIRSFTVTDLPKAVLNLFLLQSWVPLSDYYMSYNAVSWFLSDELFFYLMFPFVLPLLLNTSGRKIIIGVGIFAILYATAVLLIPLEHYHAYFYINPLFRFADFVFGILIFRLFDQRKQVAVGHVFWAEAGAILMIFVTFLLFDYIPKPYHYCSVIFWVPIAILVYVFASTSLSVNYPPPSCPTPPVAPCAHNILFKSTELRRRNVQFQTGRKGIFSQILSSHAMRLFGEASFCFYLIHQPFILVGRALAAKVGLDTNNLLAMLVFLVLTTFFSVICLKYIERPITQWLKSKLS